MARSGLAAAAVAVSLAALALAGAGCLRATSFTCSDDAACAGGTCEPVGFCSFPDTSCATGRRFGELSGAFASQCVEAAPIDAPARCSPDYAPIAGLAHRYRLITSSTSWTNQRDACAADGGYLAIPDDTAELQALLALSVSGCWVGISDRANENTFVTVLDQPATFLPWDAGEPDNSPPGQDCARISMSSQLLRDEGCSLGFRAVCECEP